MWSADKKALAINKEGIAQNPIRLSQGIDAAEKA
jgi:hypothetical protein